MSGFLYVLRLVGEEPIYKIGVTESSDPRQRVWAQGTIHFKHLGSTKTKPVFIASVHGDPFELERELHQQFKKQRLGPSTGDWFRLSERDVDYIRHHQRVIEFVPLEKKMPKQPIQLDLSHQVASVVEARRKPFVDIDNRVIERYGKTLGADGIGFYAVLGWAGDRTQSFSLDQLREMVGLSRKQVQEIASRFVECGIARVERGDLILTEIPE